MGQPEEMGAEAMNDNIISMLIMTVGITAAGLYVIHILKKPKKKNRAG